MSLKIIETLLEEKIGLAADAIGVETIAKAVQQRMESRGLAEINAYLSCIQTSKEEWEGLIEALVVPETWFFRNKESFDFFGRYIKLNWYPRHEADAFRVLSIASSTGEEPYSIAMALLDAGLGTRRFHIDAVDISTNSLEKANLGFYHQQSFRGKDLSFREKYFDTVEDGYKINTQLRGSVRFIKGNVLDISLLIGELPYDVIFCRNLLIYLSPAARRLALEVIDRLLNKTGILFVGHAERPAVINSGLELIRKRGVFAFRRSYETTKPKRRIYPKAKIGFERQRQKRGFLPDTTAVRITPAASLQVAGAKPEVPLRNEHRKLPAKNIKLLDEARRLADQGILEKALELSERCLKEDAFDVHAHFLKGLICQALGNDKKAEKCFNKAAYLDPNHHEALNYLAFIAQDRGDLDGAAQLRQRVKRIYEKEAKE